MLVSHSWLHTTRMLPLSIALHVRCSCCFPAPSAPPEPPPLACIPCICFTWPAPHRSIRSCPLPPTTVGRGLCSFSHAVTLTFSRWAAARTSVASANVEARLRVHVESARDRHCSIRGFRSSCHDYSSCLRYRRGPSAKTARSAGRRGGVAEASSSCNRSLDYSTRGAAACACEATRLRVRVSLSRRAVSAAGWEERDLESAVAAAAGACYSAAVLPPVLSPTSVGKRQARILEHRSPLRLITPAAERHGGRLPLPSPRRRTLHVPASRLLRSSRPTLAPEKGAIGTVAPQFTPVQRRQRWLTSFFQFSYLASNR